MARPPQILVLYLMFSFTSPAVAGGPCVPSDWHQCLAVITPEGSFVTFHPSCKTEQREVVEKQPVTKQVTKLVDGKEVIATVTKNVRIKRIVTRCVVDWMEVQANWSPAPGNSSAFENDGKPIEWEPLRERLKQPRLVVVSASGRMPPDAGKTSTRTTSATVPRNS